MLQTPTDLWVTISWGICILLAMYGFGLALERQLKIEIPTKLAYGVSVFLCICGPFLLLGLANDFLLVTLICIGIILFFSYFKAKYSALTILVPAAVIVILAATVHAPQYLKLADDDIAYLPLANRLLQDGNLVEPFSLRRAGAYGGGTVMQAVTLIFGNNNNALLADEGLGRILLLSILLSLGMTYRNNKKVLTPIMLFCSVVWVFPSFRINSNTSMIGMALIVAILGSLWIIKEERFCKALCLGILTAGAFVVRPHFGVLSMILVITYNFPQLIFSKKYIGQYILIVICLISPWAIALLISSATALLPPFHGNVNPEFVKFFYGTYPEFLIVLKNLTSPYFTLLILLPCLPIFLIEQLKGYRMPWFATCMFVLLGGTLLGGSPVSEVARYLVPLLVPMALFIALRIYGEVQVKKQWFLWVLPLSLLPVFLFPGWLVFYDTAQKSFAALGTHSKIKWSETQQEFTNLQTKIPKNSKVLIISQSINNANYKSHKVYSIDAIGAASPKSKSFNKMPVTSFGDFQTYLQELGIDYLLTDNFNKLPGLYSEKHWEWLNDTPNVLPMWRNVWKPTQDTILEYINSFPEKNVQYQTEHFRIIKVK